MTLSKSKLKELSAYRLQKNCDKDDVFVVEGDKMAREALELGLNIQVLCATSDWLEENKPSCNAFEISGEELSRLSNMRQPNRVWMLLSRQLPPTGLPHCGLTLALDCVQDPGNMGTIIRTADWFGIRQIVCSSNTVSCFNPKVVQSSMGSLFRVAVKYTKLTDWIGECKLPVFGALLDGDDVRDAEFPLPAVLVMGNESKGISEDVRNLLTHSVFIPNLGGSCESLNVASATAILIARWRL